MISAAPGQEKGLAIEKIVVRSPNWLGDAAMAVPALRELSRIFPQAEITLITPPGLDGLFEDADFVDRVIPLKKDGSRIRQVRGLAELLEQERGDLAILLPNSFGSALSAKLARVPARIGYNKDLRGLLLSEPIAVPEWKERRHEVYYYLNLIAEAERRFLGTATVGDAMPDASIPVSEVRRERARQMLRDAGADLSRPLIAIGAGSTNSRAKRWGEAKFGAVASRLSDEFNAQIILVGAPSETDVAREVKANTTAAPIDLTGRTNIAEAAAVLSVADLLVSNDMGLAHVAPAVGTGTVVIFGPTNPVATRPFPDNSVVIRNNVECSPCMLRECPIDHRCMEGISVEQVLDLSRRMLSGKIVE